MGAGCSGQNSTKVRDTVKAIQLSQDAKVHLQQLADKEKERQKQKHLGNNIEENVEDSIEDLDKQMAGFSKEKKNQKLWDSIECNDIKTVQFLLNHYSDTQFNQETDIYDSTGQSSMIHKAASLGHVEILMLLLERTSGKPDLVNSQLATPLHLACKNNRETVAKFLIGCGVDVNVQDEHGQTPLLICCIHGHFELAQLIVESALGGLTPLNCSAIKGDLKLTKLLIERGGAIVEEASPKGCTPLLYAARGGYSEVVRYLLEKGASPMKQDNAGGTVLHHAIEKSHLDVLQVLVEHGVDVYSAIEIADNGGRTPIFEAIDNNVSADLLRFLSRKRAKSGFGAQANVINYNGQTPLYGAVREGNLEHVMVLVEEAGAKVDLCGAQTKIEGEDDEDEEQEFDSLEEKYFMEAFRNAMTPLHLSVVLGHEPIMHYLLQNGANVNKQTSIKGYSCLHLAVLANKPEIIIELLTKSNANHMMPDYSGRTLSDMIEMFIPDYLDTFNQMIENLQIERIKSQIEGGDSLIVATHYYNPDDERQIKGAQDLQNPDLIYQQDDQESPDKSHVLFQSELEQQINEASTYQQFENNDQNENPQLQQTTVNSSKKFLDMQDHEIEVEEGRPFEIDIENIFGRKIALGLIAINWKYKEVSTKIIFKQAEKFLNKENESSSINLNEFVKACTIAVDLTCREKVIKVFTLSLQLLGVIISSQKVEDLGIIENTFKDTFIVRNICAKLLQKSEEGNTRLTNKIHEVLLDFSFHPKLGEAHVSSFILQRIQQHNKASQNKQQQNADQEQQQQQQQDTQGVGLGSYKGLLAQLALLYKFVNSFGVSIKKRGPLNVLDIVNSILPSLTHQSQDVRSASTKILLDVHRLTGKVKEETLSGIINEKTKAQLIEKLSQVKIEVQPTQQNEKQEDEASLYDLSMDDVPQVGSSQHQQNLVDLNEAKDKIAEKAKSKDWTEREIALKQVKETFEQSSKKQLQDEKFLTNCTVLLNSCLEDNNITLYLEAVDVANIFFQKAINTEVVMGSLQSLIRAIILRTTDTNTRVRKKSVDLINMIWSIQLTQDLNKNREQENEEEKKESIGSLIANVICDQSLQEKAILGRLGLFIKKVSSIESLEELNKKPHQIIIGKNYEQLIEFACQWVAHKNTKVRQNALKLIVEVCRLNSLDPRGQPFKLRIINYILGLRPSLRDPLVKKINEVCKATINTGVEEDHEEQQSRMYIDVNELELNIATKNRSISLDLKKKQSQVREGDNSKQGEQLPDIGESKGLPKVNVKLNSLNHPTIVLPHSEPLSEEQLKKFQPLIELFNQEIITCFYSQTWSTRQAAIEKVSEQLFNLDPNRRDAMSSEINKKNFPIEENFKTFIDFITEGIKDPNLKNFISILELLQKALPTFFRYIQPNFIRKDILNLVSQILKKTTDLKSKVREASINFCLYLSHQSSIGPEVMVTQVLSELESILNQQSSNVAANLGNSHMITSCLQLLQQFQQQTKILEKQKTNQILLTKFIAIINGSLKHQNPTVRKEAENLFKILYQEFGDKLDNALVSQKQQVTSKLLSEAKQESGGSSQEQKYQEQNLLRAQTHIRTEVLNQSALLILLKDQKEQLENLKLPNPKKRLKAIIEIKKAIQKELVSINQKNARELFEPLTILLRQLLQDENPDIYLESLNFLKFVVGSLAPHLSTLDLHLMMGQFIGIIVNNTIHGNLKIQMASDKVIIFFGKHNNIGPYILAKDIIKNLEKINKSISVIAKKEEQSAVVQDKKPTTLKLLSIIQLLLQHFQIVLCYQPEFYEKCLEQVADTMIQSSDDQTIKNMCIQIVLSLNSIDSKLMENAISKLDVSRKTPLRKTLIEMEHQQKQGKNIITQDHHAFVNSALTSDMTQKGKVQENNDLSSRDDRKESFINSSRTSLFSPGSTYYNQSPQIGLDSSQYEWSRKTLDTINKQSQGEPNMGGTQNSFLPDTERRAMKRIISLENDSRNRIHNPLNQSTQQKQFKEDLLRDREGRTEVDPLILPEIIPQISMQSNVYQRTAGAGGFNHSQQTYSPKANPNNNQITSKVSMTSTAGAGFSSSAAQQNVPVRALRTLSTTENPNGILSTNGAAPSQIRPPLYVPQKRDTGRSQTVTTGQPQQLAPIQQMPPLKQSFEQFKTDFNKTPFGNAGGVNSNFNSDNKNGSLGQIKNKNSSTIANLVGTAQPSIFKPQMPIGFTFESNVKRYQEPTATSKDVVKGEDSTQNEF